MSGDILNVVAPAQRPAAHDALAAAFGVTAVTAVEPVAGGASGALTYRVEAGGRSYLMRLEVRRGPMRNPHQYACMRLAADAGVAPPLRHVDDAPGVAIMDFLPQRPLSDYPGGPPALARDLGRLVARLQATPAFPVLARYPDLLGRMLEGVSSSGLFAPGLLDPHRDAFERVRAAYPWDAEPAVSSHNDPNLRNVIFDGERLWLIDWETAYRNDPLVDVAILANEAAATPELEASLLEGWLGRAPDARVRARLRLMRPVTNLYYAVLIFSLFGAAPRPAPDADLSAPSPEAFRAAIETARLPMGAPQTAYVLGKMQLAAFLASIAEPGFDAAVEALS